MCQDAWSTGSRIGFSLLCFAVLALALGAPPALIVRAAGDRGVLAGTWLAALLLGGLYIVLVYTLIEDYPTMLYVALVLLGAVGGFLAGLHRGRRLPSLAALGLIGAGSPAAVPIALFVGSLAASGTCLD